MRRIKMRGDAQNANDEQSFAREGCGYRKRDADEKRAAQNSGRNSPVVVSYRSVSMDEAYQRRSRDGPNNEHRRRHRKRERRQKYRP